MKRALRFLSLLSALCLIVCTFSACSSGMSSDTADLAYSTAGVSAEKLAVSETDDVLYTENLITSGTDGTEPSSLYTPQDDRKMIRNASLSLETEEYESSLQAIQNKIAETGAYLESSSASGYSEYHSRYTTLTVRVPAEQFETFLQAQNDFGVVTESEITQEDVTLHYTDLESRLNTLNTKKDRLTALLEKADKMEDIIDLEDALADTISEIESYTAQINQLDNLVSYCTIVIDLQEVYHATTIEIPPKTLGERIEQRFRSTTESMGEFFEDLAVVLVGDSPVLILLALVITLVTVICVSSARRKKRKWEAAVARRKEEEKHTENPS